MIRRSLGTGGPQTSRLGLGCMGMSGTYGPADRSQAIATIHAALECGINLLDTGDFYDCGANELLLHEALRGRPREQYLLSVKFGERRDPAGGWHGCDNHPLQVKNYLAYSLKRLGVDSIDIYRPARLDANVPIEDTVGAIADLVRAGYVHYIGLSEVGPETLRRAAAVHPICDLQIEYSLLSRSLEASVLPACRELGIAITAYGVLSRGLLSGHWSPERVLTGDARAWLPRFAAENIRSNLALVEALRGLAEAKGATVAQLAVAWVASRGADIFPLLGARRPEQLEESLGAAALELTATELAAIEAAVPAAAVAGTRYAAPLLAHLDSER